MGLLNFFFPAESACEQREQVHEIFKNLRAQIPLLYATVIVNLVGMHVAIGAAKMLIFSPLSLLLAVLLWRTIFWAFFQRPTESFEKAQSELLKVAVFAILLCSGFSFWTQVLISQHPDLASSIIFFHLLATLGATYGLSSFPRAAFLPLAILGLPISARLLLMGDGLTRAMGLSLLLVILLFMRLLQTHSHVLSGLISSRMEVARERNRAISAEVAALKRADEDALTGLPNRARLIREVQRHITHAGLAARGSVLAICDLDGFKAANDTFGHAAGDAILKTFGERLALAFGRQAVVARMGGDEFAIFWREGLASDAVVTAGTLICDLASQPITWEGKKLIVGASCGLAEFEPSTASLEEIMRQADSALYMAKASGRGRCQLYDQFVFSMDMRRTSLERLLLSGEANVELTVAYQPIVSVESGTIVYVEALARWDSPELGRVPPDEFIHHAERTGTIEQISDVLLAKALRGAQCLDSHIRLSFNLSAILISRQGAADRILTVLREWGFSPSRMLFEVTETAVLADAGLAKAELQALRAAGCLVALDDFGAGFASVSYLRDLVFDVVKLDGSLMTSLKDCSRSRQILLGLINLCHAADALCVAEHIEDAGQLELVKAMGCDMVQGFYLGRPAASCELIGQQSDRIALTGA